MKRKRKASRRNTERRYQKPPRCPLISGAHLHVKHHCLEPFAKKKEAKETEPKMTPRILMPQGGQI